MKDIHEVLRNKRMQLAALTLEIQGLEAATAALLPIAHLLSDEDDTPHIAAPAQISIGDNTPEAALAEAARVTVPDRSRIRRWV